MILLEEVEHQQYLLSLVEEVGIHFPMMNLHKMSKKREIKENQAKRIQPSLTNSVCFEKSTSAQLVETMASLKFLLHRNIA